MSASLNAPKAAETFGLNCCRHVLNSFDVDQVAGQPVRPSRKADGAPGGASYGGALAGASCLLWTPASNPQLSQIRITQIGEDSFKRCATTGLSGRLSPPDGSL